MGKRKEDVVKSYALVLAALLVTPFPAYAFDAEAVPAIKRTKLQQYLSAKEAAEFVEKNRPTSLFLDIRTSAETAFVGMPAMVDANVPYMVEPDFPAWDDARKTLKLELNPDFLPEVRRRLSAKALTPDSPVVLICRSGDRSAAASNLLAEAGFKTVYTVVDGFEGDLATDGPNTGRRTVNGWKNSNLPWSYRLDKSTMYKLDK
jgi:rhodanese-related sulfurtransferase